MPETRSPVRAKICGIASPAAFDAAVAGGADHIGFVFFARSPRAITPDGAAALSARHAGGPGRVGLFVAPDDDLIAATLAVVALDALQLHDVSAARAAELRARFGRPVWRAVNVRSVVDLPAHADGADALVLDAPAPPDSPLPGGNARVFDWGLLRGWAAPLPWMLAGGLTPHNVADAIRQTGAPAVDVSSGVEIERGVKDPALIHAFLRAVKDAR